MPTLELHDGRSVYWELKKGPSTGMWQQPILVHVAHPISNYDITILLRCYAIAELAGTHI